MTPAGQAVIAGLLAGLPAAQGVLAAIFGSADAARLLVGSACLLGNREPGSRRAANFHGANVEVKAVDPSANPFFAAAAILGIALDGIERNLPLPPEVTVKIPPASAHGSAKPLG